MAFFENVGKKMGEMVEVTKLNSSINSEEDKIKKLYLEIGKKTYARFSAGEEVADDIAEEVNAIKTGIENIANLKVKILEAKNLKQCIKCKGELELAVTFCPNCGEKQPVIEVKAEAPKGNACPACGASVALGTKFCNNCGAKQPEPEAKQEQAEKPRENLCPACGFAVAEGTKFCNNCGAKLAE